MIDFDATPLNFVDIETTGLRLSRDRMMEIYITKEFKGKTVKTFHSLVNPGFTPDRFILRLTNMPLHDLKNAPYFSQIADDVYTILEDGILVAHNARFDYSFIRNEFNLIGKDFKTDYCCTVKMFKKLYPRYRHHNLDTLRAVLNHFDNQKHRAQSDTEVIKKFYYSSIKTFGTDRVADSMNYAIKKSAIPKALLKFNFTSIPEQPGVYIFYGQDNYPLYVGMSNNLRRRVRDHLYSDISYTKDSLINQQLTSIKTIPTAGVLGAALRESNLVKKLEPLYNSQLRRTNSLIKVKEQQNENGYKTIVIDTSSGFQKEDLNHTLLVSRSTRSMKEFLSSLVKERGLCAKFLSLEKGMGACFSYQLGHCKGGCVGKLSPEEYNSVFDDAFAEYKIEEWPFALPIIITEEFGDQKEELLVDQWMFLGSDLGEGEELQIDKFSFNYDTYKILERYILKNRKLNIEKVTNTENIKARFSNF